MCSVLSNHRICFHFYKPDEANRPGELDLLQVQLEVKIDRPVIVRLPTILSKGCKARALLNQNS